MSQNLNWKFKAWRRVLEKLENVFAVNTKLSQLLLSLSMHYRNLMLSTAVLRVKQLQVTATQNVL